jgi:prepilin-type processing-associated H-X9-DG protein
MFGRYPKGFRVEDVLDGLSNTIMAGETLPDQCCYNGAYANNFPLAGTTIPINTFEVCPKPPGCHVRACGYKSRHPGGANFLLGDGSVCFLPESIDYRLFNELGTRNGSEAVTLP